MLGSANSIFNLIVVGDSMVGKTALVNGLVGLPFKSEYVPTVYDTFTIAVGDDVSELVIWDVAGSDDFDNLREVATYRVATPLYAVLLCYSIDNRGSLESLANRWIPELKAKTQFPNIKVAIMVGLKNDLRGSNTENEKTSSASSPETVAFFRAKLFSEFNGVSDVLECSAKTGDGVGAVFDKVTGSLHALFRRKSQRILIRPQLQHSFIERIEEQILDGVKMKVVLIGDAQSGKRSMAKAIGTRLYVEQAGQRKLLHLPVGILPSGSSTVPVTADQLPMILSSYCGQDTDLIVLCVAINQPQSLNRVLSYWLPDIYSKGMAKILPMILVGTKKDLRNDGTVSSSNLVHSCQGNKIAKIIGAVDYIECSAMTGDGVEDLRKAIEHVFLAKSCIAMQIAATEAAEQQSNKAGKNKSRTNGDCLGLFQNNKAGSH